MDDFIVIVKNNFTQKGFSGIWKIVSNDTFAGMTESNIMVLSGGRYRPLSLVSFAIEHQLWGNIPSISHLINVAVYILSGIFLFKFLKIILEFKNSEKPQRLNLKAGLITLLFISLPSHSEPVINIKGRDDLMCLMFFLLAILQLINFIRSHSNSNLFFSSLFFFLSLMSKETALTFVIIFPLILYFFTNAGKNKIITSTSIYFSIALLFLFFRYLAIIDNHGIPSNDILNNPFVNANAEQRIATILLSWLYYFRLLVLPFQLSYDYNFNQIPITNFADWRVILSLCLHLVLFLIAILLFKKKSIYSFAILFYIITFSILSNLFFNIGTIFAERFIFIPSIGYCIVPVIIGFSILEKLKTQVLVNLYKGLAITFFLSILLLHNIRNIARCRDWKDNNTLFIADTKSTPNSAKIQLNAAIACINLSSNKDSVERDSLLNKAINYLHKGINIYPDYIEGYINMGVSYIRLNDIDSAEIWWNKARKMNPDHQGFLDYDKILSNHYFTAGLKFGTDRNFKESISNMLRALHYDPMNIEILYNLGGAYFTIQKNDSAKYFFQKVLTKNPSYQKAKEGLSAIEMLQRK